MFRGKKVRFAEADGVWRLAVFEPRNYQLVSEGSGFRFLDPSSNLIYSFSGSGRLTGVEDRNGNALTLT